MTTRKDSYYSSPQRNENKRSGRSGDGGAYYGDPYASRSAREDLRRPTDSRDSHDSRDDALRTRQDDADFSRDRYTGNRRDAKTRGSRKRTRGQAPTSRRTPSTGDGRRESPYSAYSSRPETALYDDDLGYDARTSQGRGSTRASAQAARKGRTSQNERGSRAARNGRDERAAAASRTPDRSYSSHDDAWDRPRALAPNESFENDGYEQEPPRASRGNRRKTTADYSRSAYTGAEAAERPRRVSNLEGNPLARTRRRAKANSYAAVDRDPNGYARGSYSDDEERRRKRRRRGFRIAGVIGALLVIVALCVGGAYLYARATMAKPFYVLMLGSDIDENDTVRTDTLMLAHVDPVNKTAALISLPRDTRVNLEGYGYCKLNSAYTYGGIDLALDTVEQLAGVKIPYYAVVNYNGLSNVVKALGGVEVDVPVYVTATDDEGIPLYDVDGTELEDVSPGPQTLNGRQALTLCRSRYYANGDYQRTANQRLLLEAIAHKVLASKPLDMYDGITGVLECVDTNLSKMQLFVCAMFMRDMDTETGIWTMVAPSEDAYIDGIAWVILDEDGWNEMMRDIKAGVKPAAANETMTSEVLETGY